MQLFSIRLLSSGPYASMGKFDKLLITPGINTIACVLIIDQFHRIMTTRAPVNRVWTLRFVIIVIFWLFGNVNSTQQYTSDGNKNEDTRNDAETKICNSKEDQVEDFGGKCSNNIPENNVLIEKKNDDKEKDDNDSDNNEDDDSDDDSDDDLTPPMPPTCRLVMAESTIPNSGWGVYTMTTIPKRGVPVNFGDVVIQVPDLNKTHAEGLRFLLWDYMWDSQETGGQYEGMVVYSMVPGLGMLCNGHKTQTNVLPYRPDVGEADLPRTTSPGAGAITHYHNYSFYTQRPLEAGTEIFVNYGKKWVNERKQRLTNDEEHVNERSISWLRQNGLCLDNLYPGRSTNKDAGRGAFATRYLPQGSVVAPLPLAPISSRSTLHTTRIKQADTPGKPDIHVEGHQLLLNYAFGHTNSSLLLYPYSPIVNLINHGDSQKANVKLRWSKSSLHYGREWLNWSLDKVKHLNRSGLLMELVATCDIKPKEEIFLDYGQDWEDAWNDHVKHWKSPSNADRYAPAYVMDDVVAMLRLEVEQKNHPYPDNVFTSCFYRFSDNQEAALKAAEYDKMNKGGKTTFKWKLSRGLFDFQNLRPCQVLQRAKTEDGTVFYTVNIKNRYGMASEERIPKGMMHIVTQVPRHAIRFSDKLYTTDQHLENAFRHEIGIPEELFPKQWMDLP